MEPYSLLPLPPVTSARDEQPAPHSIASHSVQQANLSQQRSNQQSEDHSITDLIKNIVSDLNLSSSSDSDNMAAQLKVKLINISNDTDMLPLSNDERAILLQEKMGVATDKVDERYLELIRNTFSNKSTIFQVENSDSHRDNTPAPESMMSSNGSHSASVSAHVSDRPDVILDLTGPLSSRVIQEDTTVGQQHAEATSWTKRVAQTVWDEVSRDVKSVLHTADDTKIQNMLRPGLHLARNTLANTAIETYRNDLLNVDVMRNDIIKIRELLAQTKAEEPKLGQKLSTRLDQLEKSLDGISNVTPAAKRALLISMINVAGLIPPWIIGLRPQEDDVNSIFVALNSGFQAKTLLISAGHLQSPSFNENNAEDFFKTRHLLALVNFVKYLPQTFSQDIRDALSDPDTSESTRLGQVVNIGFGAISLVTLLATFFPKEIGFAANKLTSSISDGLSGSTFYPRIEAQAKNLSDEALGELREIAPLIKSAKTKIETSRAVISDQHDLQPSAALSAHIQKSVKSLAMLGNEVGAALAVTGRVSTTDDAAQSDDSSGAQASNPLAMKVALATTALMAGSWNTFLAREEPLSLANLGADTLFTFSYLMSKALDPSVDSNEAVRQFSSFAGLTVMSTIVLSANDAMKNDEDDGPIQSSDAGLAIAAAIFIAATPTMPSLIGKTAAHVEQMIFNLPSSIVSAISNYMNSSHAPPIDDEMGFQFQQSFGEFSDNEIQAQERHVFVPIEPDFSSGAGDIDNEDSSNSASPRLGFDVAADQPEITEVKLSEFMASIETDAFDAPHVVQQTVSSPNADFADESEFISYASETLSEIAANSSMEDMNDFTERLGQVIAILPDLMRDQESRSDSVN